MSEDDKRYTFENCGDNRLKTAGGKSKGHFVDPMLKLYRHIPLMLLANTDVPNGHAKSEGITTLRLSSAINSPLSSVMEHLSCLERIVRSFLGKVANFVPRRDKTGFLCEPWRNAKWSEQKQAACLSAYHRISRKICQYPNLAWTFATGTNSHVAWYTKHIHLEKLVPTI